ncbi:uncharacterized protein LOC117782079 [Drosophila innubila]|uniref:uncharacterized protein LOC117782079 n=1 Tax=Drosophila innubila TaxID=198719 RepID=UPI00148E3EA7|nr:uncharacterized protein LOC117782079 [Drosophila innubila]
MDNDNKKPPDDEKAEHQPNTQNVLQLADGHVGETETDELILRHVSFEMPSSTLECLNLDEAEVLVQDMIESILPNLEPDKVASTSTLTSLTRYDDERMHRILRLLDRYTRKLEAIEEQMQSSSREAHSSQGEERLGQQMKLTQHCELATQTLPLKSQSLGMISSRRINQEQQQQQQQQEMEIIPPCECRHHIITISANSSSPFATPSPRRTFMGRIGQTLGDFAGALCLCLHVNKDCIFCLGFFLAFVISASFLTAFFYRTISLSTTPIRVPIDSVRVTPVPSASETAALRLNGGYYYIYNTHRQHFV